MAAIGLLNAIDRFDPAREVRFSTYASATIVGELKRHFRDKGWAVRVPRRLQELTVSLNQTIPELTSSLGRSPSVPELAKHLNVEPEDIVEAMEASQAYSTSSLDTPLGESDLTPLDTMGRDDESLELVHEWASLAPALERLPARERRVLYLRFFRGLTQSEIAKDIGVSQMHVSRILTATLEQLRRIYRADVRCFVPGVFVTALGRERLTPTSQGGRHERDERHRTEGAMDKAKGKVKETAGESHRQ